MSYDLERLVEAFRARPVTVPLDRATERRVRAYMDRTNHELRRFGDQLLDLDDDADVAMSMMGLVERGLRAAETEDGLAASPFGDLMSREVRDEQLRREFPDLLPGASSLPPAVAADDAQPCEGASAETTFDRDPGQELRPVTTVGGGTRARVAWDRGPASPGPAGSGIAASACPSYGAASLSSRSPGRELAATFADWLRDRWIGLAGCALVLAPFVAMIAQEALR